MYKHWPLNTVPCRSNTTPATDQQGRHSSRPYAGIEDLAGVDPMPRDTITVHGTYVSVLMKAVGGIISFSPAGTRTHRQSNVDCALPKIQRRCGVEVQGSGENEWAALGEGLNHGGGLGGEHKTRHEYISYTPDTSRYICR
jgi:hypothetical protein